MGFDSVDRRFAPKKIGLECILCETTKDVEVVNRFKVGSHPYRVALCREHKFIPIPDQLIPPPSPKQTSCPKQEDLYDGD